MAEIENTSDGLLIESESQAHIGKNNSTSDSPFDLPDRIKMLSQNRLRIINRFWRFQGHVEYADASVLNKRQRGEKRMRWIGRIHSIMHH